MARYYVVLRISVLEMELLEYWGNACLLELKIQTFEEIFFPHWLNQTNGCSGSDMDPFVNSIKVELKS